MAFSSRKSHLESSSHGTITLVPLNKAHARNSDVGPQSTPPSKYLEVDLDIQIHRDWLAILFAGLKRY